MFYVTNAKYIIASFRSTTVLQQHIARTVTHRRMKAKGW